MASSFAAWDRGRPSVGSTSRISFQPDDGAVAVEGLVIGRNRHAAAAGGNHQAGLLAQVLQNVRFQLPEGSLAVPGDDFCDGPPGTGFQLRVGIQKLLSQYPGENGAHGGLAASGHTDENHILHLCPKRAIDGADHTVVDFCTGEPFGAFLGLGHQHFQAVLCFQATFFCLQAEFLSGRDCR